MNIIYLDGQYIRVGPQTMEAFRPGAFKAHGVFETMRALDGVIMDLGPHLSRLRRGLRVLGIRPPSENRRGKPPEVQEAVLRELLRRNRLSEARLRLMVWSQGKQRHVAMLAEAYTEPHQKEYRVCLVKTNRQETERFADVKSLDYRLFADSLSYAHAQGYDEALLVNRRGHIFEASRANVFWMKEGILYTPPLSSGSLNGITRQKVMTLARRFKMTVAEKNLTTDLLKKADTVFLTNSLMGIRPVLVGADLVSARHGGPTTKS